MFIFTLVQVIASDRRSLPRPAHSSSQIFPITSLYQIFCRWHLWAVILLFCFCDIFFILYVWIFLTLLPSFISPCFWYFDISEDFYSSSDSIGGFHFNQSHISTWYLYCYSSVTLTLWLFFGRNIKNVALEVNKSSQSVLRGTRMCGTRFTSIYSTVSETFYTKPQMWTSRWRQRKSQGITKITHVVLSYNSLSLHVHVGLNLCVLLLLCVMCMMKNKRTNLL